MKPLAKATLFWFFLCAEAVASAPQFPFDESELHSLPSLAEWLGLWTPPLSEFGAKSFTYQVSGEWPTYAVDYSEYLESAQVTWDRYAEIVVFSPDSSLALDEFVFQISGKSGELVVWRDVDSYVALVEPEALSGTVVITAGMTMGFDLTCWLSTSTFLVAGSSWDATHENLSPMLWRFDLEKRTWTAYEGPRISREQATGPGRIERIGEWYRERFPALRW